MRRLAVLPCLAPRSRQMLPRPAEGAFSKSLARMRVRSLGFLLAFLLLLPGALATHDPTRDLTGEVEGGSSIIMALEATGTITSMGAGSERSPSSLYEVTHRSVWSYSWGGTVQLDLRADGALSGDAQLTGTGSGSLHEHMHRTVYDFEGDVVNEIDNYKDCEPRAAIFNAGQRYAAASLDKATGELLVLIESIADPTGPQDCTWRGEGGFTETTRMWPRPPLSPLVTEGIRLAGANDPRLMKLSPNLDEANAANALIFTIPLDAGHSIVRGGQSASFPIIHGSSPLGYICPSTSEQQIVQGTCTAAGTLQVRILVDPCPLAKESRAVHLKAVQDLKRPANGSSESQVRAFQVDVRQKVNSLLADERVIQLLCTDEGDDGTLVAVAEATQKVIDAWEDVAKTHGLSDEGKRDYVSAERARQLSGGGDASAASVELIGAVISSPGEYGAFSVKAHSPVALHAWDETGRHVGWNETTNASESQIEGANYTGEPGGAQELTLPSGLYRIATIELGAGQYTLNSGWNGTAGEGFELLPLQSASGRTLVANYLLDQHGLIVGPTQRIATKADAPFAFVDAWAPLPGDAAMGDDAEAFASNDGSETDETAPTPPVAVPLFLVALVCIALLRRRVM